MRDASAVKTDGDEFYVGYLPKAPRGVARVVRAAVAGFVLVGVVSAVVGAAAFKRPAAAVWGDEEIKLRGVLHERPYPILKFVDTAGATRHALVVDGGKHGAEERVRGLEGATVELTGTMIRRDDRMLFELSEGLRAVVDLKQPAAGPMVLGEGREVTVEGEIIDPKCFLGAMKPGEGKLHKACAIRCISGGIPPMLAERNPAGGITYYLLVAEDGSPANGLVLDHVGEPVRVRGRVQVVDDLRVLRVLAGGINDR